jgi:hypothetical protein
VAKEAKKPADYEPKVPDQLKKQIEEAEAIRAQMGPETAPPEGGAEASPPQPDAPSSEPEATPQQLPPPPEESWEQKFRSQQGRMEQLLTSNRDLHERITQLDNLIATMQAKGAEPPAEPKPKEKPRYVTEQEAADYGDELLGVMGKRAREEIAPDVEELSSRLAKLEGRVEGVGKVMERGQTQDVYVGLDQHVQNWRDINKDDNFKLWLEQPDPYSGRKRHDMLAEAFSRHETGRVVAFFRGFLTEATGLPQNPSSPGQSAPPLPNGNGSGKPSLEDFAAPGRARSAPQALSPDKPIYTSAQIAQFFADKRVGKYKGREAQADEIERDIFQAQHEGRIH